MTLGEQVERLTKRVDYLTVLSNLTLEKMTKEEVDEVIERATILTNGNK